ncbi:hypothetical protein CCY99_00975 [Helicobacter sp. 16-1353]|uniref:threonine/serine ThrE exporter family protein n=1 Tax=Helicobacter sp. 16-1353 TaxID=2004996 RepID=UPI000DCC915F|nr:threonine/serine exporter family protein [Helicobacter sp. 16-1353]RAX55304.1 hypothetical protein CCY99_00975 [Helicobacter sp. 16-1353]
MKTAEIQELIEFLMEYSISMLSIGTYTSRVEKCVTRIGEAFGYEVHISIFSKNISISVLAPNNYSISRTYVRKYTERGINFNVISRLSALSWHAYDEKITFKQLKKLYEKIIHTNHYSYISTLLLVCFANAAFCRLFGGDFISMPIVFVATFIGFNLRKILLLLNADIRFIFVVCSFVASMSAHMGTIIVSTKTPDVAIGTSVLFLIPGVYLINSVIDVLDGHSLIGLSRAISTLILISCIAIGLYITLNITGMRMEY